MSPLLHAACVAEVAGFSEDFFPLCSYLNRKRLWVLHCFLGQSPGMWRRKVHHFIPGGAGSADELEGWKLWFAGVALRLRKKTEMVALLNNLVVNKSMGFNPAVR